MSYNDYYCEHSVPLHSEAYCRYCEIETLRRRLRRAQAEVHDLTERLEEELNRRRA
jgi:hypothetical protein